MDKAPHSPTRPRVVCCAHRTLRTVLIFCLGFSCGILKRPALFQYPLPVEKCEGVAVVVPDSSKTPVRETTTTTTANNGDHAASTVLPTVQLNTVLPKVLPPQDRKKEHLFVHIGKAGGSSIQAMARKAKTKCEELQSITNRNETFQLLESQVCALATIPDGRVHLRDRLSPTDFYAKYSQFFVNLRDPIDRLASWYNYELVAFQKEPRWSKKDKPGEPSDNFKKLSQECFPGKNGFAAMVAGGLFLASESEKEIDHKENLSSGLGLTCNELARVCLKGDIMCYGHNYYNYETYLEEILKRKGLDGRFPQEPLRIDVIRSEHSMEDFNRTVGLWTSDTYEDFDRDYNGVTPFVQSLYGRVRSIQKYSNSNKPQRTEILSLPARKALCQHICHELVVYKTILRAADNLSLENVQESYKALDDHCGFDVDLECGTTWTYRDIKTKKNVFQQPW